MVNKPDASQLNRALYDRIADEYVSAYIGDSDNRYIDQFLALLPPNSSILDVGCGPGGSTDYIRRRGFQATGIDISPVMIGLARKTYPQTNFTVMDMQQINLPRGGFSGIISAWSLIHIPSFDLPEVLSGFNRLLTSPGYLLICAQKGPRDKILPDPLTHTESGFVSFFTKSRLTRLLKHAGFTVISWQEIPTTYPDWKGVTGLIYTLAVKS